MIMGLRRVLEQVTPLAGGLSMLKTDLPQDMARIHFRCQAVAEECLCQPWDFKLPERLRSCQRSRQDPGHLMAFHLLRPVSPRFLLLRTVSQDL